MRPVIEFPRVLPFCLSWFDQLEMRYIPRGQPGPDIPSVYLFFDRFDHVSYVGQSKRVIQRWARWESVGKFPPSAWHTGGYFYPGLEDEGDRLALEALLILLLRPAGNRGLNLGVMPSKIWAVRYNKKYGAAQEG